jgi:hypothetical protein
MVSVPPSQVGVTLFFPHAASDITIAEASKTAVSFFINQYLPIFDPRSIIPAVGQGKRRRNEAFRAKKCQL